MVVQREPPELRREIERAGSASHPALMAWARARFDAAYLVDVSFQVDADDLGETGLPDSLRGPLSDIFRAAAVFEAEVIDLVQRQVRAVITGVGEGTALDRVGAITQASHAAATDLAQQLSSVVSTDRRN